MLVQLLSGVEQCYLAVHAVLGQHAVFMVLMQSLAKAPAVCVCIICY
jgi:hypothetical protein